MLPVDGPVSRVAVNPFSLAQHEYTFQTTKLGPRMIKNMHKTVSMVTQQLVKSLLILFIRDTLAKSEDPDEMPHKAAFHQGLHTIC